MNIKYPAVITKEKVRLNAYGQKAWGEVNYRQWLTSSGYKEIGSIEYVRGYRQAIKDVKALNKGNFNDKFS